MTVGELIKKLNKRDKSQRVYYIDKYGKHEITGVQPMLTKDGTVTIIMNGDGGRYERKDAIIEHTETNVETMSCQECKHFRENMPCRPYIVGLECKYEPKDEPQTEREGE